MRSGRSRATADSRLLSLVLRHRPEVAGVQLDEAGWVDVDLLLAGLARTGRPMTRARLERLVATSDKQRFTLRDGRVRAAQGHSVPVELGLREATPPGVLFHGTPVRSVAPILASGLERRSRHAVHLSGDAATAHRVGARRGAAAVLEVDAAAMAADGHAFFRAENGVWLVDAVAPRYLRLLRGTDWGMGIVGVGVDVVQVARLERALARTPALAGRLFTELERSAARPESLAARFAAKEAVAKALGAPGGLRWQEAEVVTDPGGRPRLVLHGGVADEARAQGISTWHLSLSHDGGIATAVVVAEA